MAYKDPNNKEFLQDIVEHKEFYVSKLDRSNEIKDDSPYANKGLNVFTYQAFVKKYLSPNTTFDRLLLKHGTGSGKTLTSIQVSLDFIALYKKQYEKYKTSPTVFYIGFTKDNIIKELLKFPELNYISKDEIQELERLKKLTESNDPTHIKRYKLKFAYYRKRLIKKNKGGFYQFFGYREFVNRLFNITSDNVDLIELFSKYGDDYKRFNEEISKLESSRKLRIDHKLLESFENSLLICDEIHNVYNSLDKNNWGVAIQYVLDNIPSLRALFMSATPINNNPSEIIDVINLLVPRDQKIKRKDVFINPKTIKDSGMEKIRKLAQGRIAYLQNNLTTDYPERIILGESVPGIPYLKFIKCPMSSLHYKTYTNILRKELVSIEKLSIIDIAFPNPDDSKMGLFKSTELISRINNASDKWRNQVGISIEEKGAFNLIVGQFLERENIKQYSTKYYQLLKDVQQILKGNENGKIFIYHNRVSTSGVLLIQELFRYNGYIDEYSDPVANTLCAVCQKPMKGHKYNHIYSPTRFITVYHGESDKDLIQRSLAKFNSKDNVQGHKYKIIIGSRKIKESYELKAVKHVLIMSLPINIPTLIQVFGRSIRTRSHVDLDPQDRKAHIRIYVSSLPQGAEVPNNIPSEYKKYFKLSYELTKYKEKMEDFKIIQQVEKILHEVAVDQVINRPFIMSEEQLQKYGNLKKPNDLLDGLYFDMSVKKTEYSLDELNLSTFKAYKYHEKETEIVLRIIKRLFLEEKHIWTYKELFDTIRNPPFHVEYNMSLVDESSFNIALTFLVRDSNIHTETKVPGLCPTTSCDLIKNQNCIDKIDFVTKLFNSNDRILHGINGYKYVVKHVSKYYILALDEDIVDIESYINPIHCASSLSISLKRYLQETNIDFKNKKQNLLQLLKDDQLDEYTDLFKLYDDKFNVTLLEDFIQDYASYRNIRDTIEDIVDQFGILVYNKDASKLPTGLKHQFNVGKSCHPIGYYYRRIIKLYTKNKTWIEINRSLLPAFKSEEENNILIGYYENGKFKIRPPMKSIKKTSDQRLLEKGVVCMTKSKPYLITVSKKLKIYDSSVDRIKKLCHSIESKLVELEIKERKKKNRVRYVYMFNEYNPLT